MLLLKNKKASYNFEILDKYTAGIILEGWEVKSIRNSSVNLSDSFCYIENGEIFVKNMKVSRYKSSHKLIIQNEERIKKLLLNKKEINRIQKDISDQGKTIIVLDIFLKDNKIKLNIAIARGKKTYDKRESIKQKDLDVDLKRINR
jgi:SsrA-binding protein